MTGTLRAPSVPLGLTGSLILNDAPQCTRARFSETAARTFSSFDRQTARSVKALTASSPGLTGRSSKPRPIRSRTALSGILDAPLSRSMTAESVTGIFPAEHFPRRAFQHMLHLLAARFAPELLGA